MFPNLRGSPMDLGNLLNRAILPALNRCAVCGKRNADTRLARTPHQITNLSETRFFPSGTAGTLHGGDWARTCTAWVCRTKRFRPSFATQRCPPTNTYYTKSAADDTQAAMAKLERLVIGNEAQTEAEQHDIFATGNEVATKAADANPAAIQ